VLAQLSLLQQARVGIPDRLRDGWILDRGDAFAVQGVDDLQDALALLRGRGRRHEIEHRAHGGLLEDAGGHPRSVAIDGAGDGIRRARADPGEAQGGRVGDAIVTGGVHQPHRIPGRDAIQIRRRQVAPLGEFAFVPSIALQPCARRQAGESGLHAANGLLHARHVAQVHVVEIIDSSLRDVRMGVDESGGGGTPAQVDAPGGGPRETQDRLVRPGGDDLPAAHRQRFDDGVARIHGDDPAMEEHQIRRRCTLGRQRERCGAETGGGERGGAEAGGRRDAAHHRKRRIDSGGHNRHPDILARRIQLLIEIDTIDSTP
jgi:hypothetical protein